MQNVKETAKVLLIQYYTNIIYAYDYSNISCSWRKFWSGLFEGQEKKAGCNKSHCLVLTNPPQFQ